MKLLILGLLALIGKFQRETKRKILTFLKPSRVILYISLIILAFLFLLPMWSCITTSLKRKEEVALGRPLMFPLSPYTEPHMTALKALKRPLFNSAIFTVAATILSCFLGSINGYILTKIRFKGDNTVFLLIIVGTFLPYQTILVPLVQTMRTLGLYNTLWAMILTHTAYGIPICTLLFRNFYGGIPDSIINSAKVEGAGTWTIYRRIILPLSWLPFAVAAIFQFTSIWNDYLFGLILTVGEYSEAWPATRALDNLKGTFAAEWNVQMAGALWVALPVLIIYLVLGKYLIRGYMAGAVKG